MPVLLVYLILTFTRPFELFLWLAPLHLMQLVGGIGILATIASAPQSGFSFRSKQLYMTLLFMFLVTISPILSTHWFGGAIGAAEETGITVTVFLMALLNLTTIHRVRLFLGTISAVAVYLAIQSIMAVHFGYFANILLLTQRMNEASDAMFSRVRATGFMFDPNDLAQTFVMTFPFLGVLWRKGNLVRNFFMVVAPMMLLVYGIFLTHSRGAVLSLMVILMAAVAGSRGKIAAGLATALGGMAAMAVNFTGGRAISAAGDESAAQRLEAWSAGLQFLKWHPLTGVGYNQFAQNNPITAHNSVVLCFAELGFPTFCVWVGLIALTLVELSRLRKLKVETPLDAEIRRYGRAIQLSLFGFLTSAWFLSRTYIVTLYLLIAAAAAVVDIARRAGKPIPQPSFPRIATMSVGAATGLIMVVYITIKASVR